MIHYVVTWSCSLTPSADAPGVAPGDSLLPALGEAREWSTRPHCLARILVGSGLRRAEICGLAVLGPDGLSDVMTDSIGRGRVELRVRWDAGAKGRKSRQPFQPRAQQLPKRSKRDRNRPFSGSQNVMVGRARFELAVSWSQTGG